MSLSAHCLAEEVSVVESTRAMTALVLDERARTWMELAKSKLMALVAETIWIARDCYLFQAVALVMSIPLSALPVSVQLIEVLA